MAGRGDVVALFTTLLVFSGAALAGAPFPATTLSTSYPRTPLNLTAQFLGWTEYGPGTPCEGGHRTPGAHFAANATGGTPPYSFLWAFGDGSNDSTIQNPTHIFVGEGYPSKVIVAVTDARGISNSTTVPVRPATWACPASIVPHEFLPWLPFAGLAMVAISSLAALAAVMTITLSIRDRQRASSCRE